MRLFFIVRKKFSLTLLSNVKSFPSVYLAPSVLMQRLPVVLKKPKDDLVAADDDVADLQVSLDPHHW